ncbi:MAG: hypothetical protein PHF67_00195 [Candidatus Nanoarchaeia archaeon]|nr:hypothetical protein [Candidatus Nanoarchaeia archaeon]
METPYFLFKPKILVQNYLEFENLCQRCFPSFKICYSVKTNSFSGVIKTLTKLGSSFEVASLNEMKLVPKKFVVFNGPCKTEEELKIAIKNKFLINVDSKSEINKIYNLARGNNLEIGLRVSFKESKFGFDEKQLIDMVDYAVSKNLSVSCIHFHQGTQMNLSEYKANLDKLSIFIYFLDKKGIKLKYIDIGGGFPDKVQLKNLSLNLENYFNAINQYLSKFNLTIILEPGRNLVCDAFELITQVNVIKENFGRTYAVLDAGINLLPKITLSTYKFSKLNKENLNPKNKTSQRGEYILAGPLLFSNDILGKFFGNLKEGDLIKIENVGAYCYNLAWELSYKKPRIVAEKN